MALDDDDDEDNDLIKFELQDQQKKKFLNSNPNQQYFFNINDVDSTINSQTTSVMCPSSQVILAADSGDHWDLSSIIK